MQAQQLKVDTIANNLANASTRGFKSSRVEFQDMLYISPVPAGAAGDAGDEQGAVPNVLQVGTGVSPGAIARDFSQGSVEDTGRELDLAIDGDGFFQVKLADGSTAYTRNGSFSLSKDSGGRFVLADSAGNPVLGKNGQPLTLPQNWETIEIGSTGTVTARLSGGTVSSVGEIGIAYFPTPVGLEGIGGNLFRESAASGKAVQGKPGTDVGLIRQGALEGSNVQVIAEMVNLIVAQRAYEISARAIQGSDQMMEIANNLRR